MTIKDRNGGVAVLHQHLVYNDPIFGYDRGEDLIYEWFNHSGNIFIVHDVRSSIDFLLDWVYCRGDFNGEKEIPGVYREITVDGEVFANDKKSMELNYFGWFYCRGDFNGEKL